MGDDNENHTEGLGRREDGRTPKDESMNALFLYACVCIFCLIPSMCSGQRGNW